MNDDNAGALAEHLARLEEEANAWLQRENVQRESRILLRSGDMRYPLQNYELNVSLPPGKVTASWILCAREQFHSAHERHYSYCDRSERVQLVTLRVSAIGRTTKIRPPQIPAGDRSPRQAIKGERRVHFQEAGDFLPSLIYERALLRAGWIVYVVADGNTRIEKS